MDLFDSPGRQLGIPPHTRKGASIQRTLVALALLAAGVVLYVLLAATPADGGWIHRRWSNELFEGTPVSSGLVSEPFERDEPSLPFSAEWSSWLRVERPGRYEFVVEADDSVELSVGGQRLIDYRGRRTRTELRGAVALGGAPVPVVLRLSDHGGGKYLRVFWYELEAPHGWSPVPLPRGVAFPSRALALAARKPLSETARTCLFGAVLAFLSVGLALGIGDFARRSGGLRLDRRELALAVAVVLVALGTRFSGLGSADIYCDEGAYLKAGMHYVRNAELGDLAPQSFRWNREHLPVAKWLYGAAERAGGMRGAKLLAAFLQAMTCLIVFLIGRRHGSLWVGASAGMLLALIPYFVGHGRVVGLEAPLVFFFALSAWLLMLACERDSWRLHAAWGLTSILSVGSKATGVWFAPIALLVCGAALAQRRSRFRPMLGAFAGAAVGVLVLFLAWPWLWHDPIAQLQNTWGHWAGYVPEEYLLGVRRKLPAWYFSFAFLVANPTGLLALALVWLGFAIRRRSPLDWLVLGWLLFPFGQSFSWMRQDGARYVIQAFPALALAAAAGLELAVEKLGVPWIKRAAHPALWVYVAGAMVYLHPYELDYASEWAGGNAGVMARRWLEIPFWGEGQRELVDETNRIAPVGAKVHLALMLRDDAPSLRADLVPAPLESADYLLLYRFQYPAAPRGFSPIYEVRAGAGVIATVYKRDR